MATRTVTALYDTKDTAEQAKDRLKAAGVDAVDIHNQDAADSLTDTARAAGGKTRGLLDRIAEFFGGHHEDVHAYAEGVRRGHYLLTAKVDEANADTASTLLGSSGAVDFDKAQDSWRAEGWAPGQRAYDQGASATSARTDDTRGTAPAYEQAVATPLGSASAANLTGAGAATADSFGQPASTGAQVQPQTAAQTTPAGSSAATTPFAGSTADSGDAAPERVTDGGSGSHATGGARRDDERSNAYVRSYAMDDGRPALGAAAAGEAAGEGLLTQGTTVRDVFEPKMDPARDLDQGMAQTDIKPGGSLNRPA